MRKLLLLLLLTSCVQMQPPVMIDDLNAMVRLNGDCELVLKRGNSTVVHPFNFKSPQLCRLVTKPGAELIDARLIDGAYVFFVENNKKSISKCSSEYTAFGLTKSERILVTSVIKKANTCFLSKDWEEFEYFSSKLR